jgi:hypothetical protein
MSVLSSRFTIKPTTKQPEAVSRQNLFVIDFFFEPEDGGEIFVSNFGCLPTDYAALCPRREITS